MKMHFTSRSFAVLTAALMMVGSVACTSIPTQEEAPMTEAAVSEPVVQSELESPVAQQDPLEAPVVEESTTLDTVSGAPSSLGASSSGRGH